jgi:hypothetical protein
MGLIRTAKEFFCKECFSNFNEDQIVIFLEEEKETVCQSCANKYSDDQKQYQRVEWEKE